MNKSTFPIISFLVLFLLSTLLVIQIFWSLITPFIFALVLLSVFLPLHVFLLKIVKGREILAASISVGAAFLIVFLPLGYFVSKLGNQALAYYEQSKSNELFRQVFSGFSTDNVFISNIKDFAQKHGINVSTQTLIDTVESVIQKFALLIYDELGGLASHSLLIVLDTVLTFVILFALLVKGRVLKNYIMQLAPLPFAEQEKLISQFGEISKAIFLSTSLINVITGIFGGLCFYAFGIGPGTFWGVLIFFASFMPAVGAWIIVGPAGLFLFATGNSEFAVIYLLVNALGLGILELVVKPKFIGRNSRLHTVLVLLSILGGVQVFGVFGIFYGPLVVAMFLTLAEIYIEHYRELLIKDPQSEKLNKSVSISDGN